MEIKEEWYTATCRTAEEFEEKESAAWEKIAEDAAEWRIERAKRDAKFEVARGWLDGESMKMHTMGEFPSFEKASEFMEKEGGTIFRLSDGAFWLDGCWHDGDSGNIVS